MSDMLIRCARAMIANFDDLPEVSQRQDVERVRRVIAALLDPTDEMVRAGWDAYAEDAPPNLPERIFAAMISRAIS